MGRGMISVDKGFRIFSWSSRTDASGFSRPACSADPSPQTLRFRQLGDRAVRGVQVGQVNSHSSTEVIHAKVILQRLRRVFVVFWVRR